MHVPLTTRQAAGRDSPPPSMSVGDMARGIEAALAAVLQHLKGEMV
jgi:pyrrolidone-carboxylate peptidase